MEKMLFLYIIFKFIQYLTLKFRIIMNFGRKLNNIMIKNNYSMYNILFKKILDEYFFVNKIYNSINL